MDTSDSYIKESVPQGFTAFTCIWPKQECAAKQGMVFVLSLSPKTRYVILCEFVLNWVINLRVLS